MDWRYLFWFWGLGMLSVIIVRTSYEPLNEYLYTLEPAHNLIFGYGKLPFDWQYGIRSYAYPFIIAIIYKILAILHLDYVNALIYAPRILQATISAIGHYYTCKVATIVAGPFNDNDGQNADVMFWTAAALSTNWFLFYCMSRTMYEGIETVCIVFALKYSTWSLEVKGDQMRLLMATFVGCIIRPSSAFILFSITCFQYLWRQTYHKKTGLVVRRWEFKKLLFWGWIIAISSQIIIDYSCYGTFWITPWEFLKLNIRFDLYDHYIEFPFYIVWYVGIGLPTVLFTHLAVLVVALIKETSITLLCLWIWILVWYSCFGLRQITVLLPIVSLSCIIIGVYLKKMQCAHLRNRTNNWHPRWVVPLLFITNLPLAIFFGCYHKQGTLGAMQFLAQDKTPDNLMNVTFLMPCYSMPAYSHLHRNVSLQFLSCEPNLHEIRKYRDETYLFYDDPNKWISGHIDLNASTHIVIFDTLKDKIWDFLQNYKLCARIFHSAYLERKYVEIYCK